MENIVTREARVTDDDDCKAARAKEQRKTRGMVEGRRRGKINLEGKRAAV
jgi:hypothetical protein